MKRNIFDKNDKAHKKKTENLFLNKVTKYYKYYDIIQIIWFLCSSVFYKIKRSKALV